MSEKKIKQQYARLCGIYEIAKSSSDAYSKPAKTRSPLKVAFQVCFDL